MSRSTINRRKVLKGSLAGGIIAASAGATHSAASPERWDREVDVVVIGSGTGLLGALVAAKAGKRVLVLEKGSAPGGNTLVSGGVFWVPNNRIMRREGLSDSREQALTYLNKLSLGQADSTLMEAFVDHGPDMADYLEQHTTMTLRVSKLMGAVADYHPEWPGSNVKGRSLEPAQPQVALAGGLLVSSLLVAVTGAGGELLTATPARQLLTATDADGQSRVVGVLAEHDGKPLRIRARTGVLLASGGFERNPTMKTHFLRGPSPYTFGATTNTGDGIHMGMALGADLRNMNEVWGMTVYTADAEANGSRTGGMSLAAQIERRNPGCIAVNRYGERFCNESADYDSSWRSYHTWQNWGDLGYRNMPAFHIFDQTYRERYALAGHSPDQPLPAWVTVADSLEQLARQLGIDPEGLRRNIDRYNHYAKLGQDPDFHRGASRYDRNDPAADQAAALAPVIKAPFYGAQVSPADLGTCGGLRVNGQAQVVNVFDQPINGLYASGNTAGVAAIRLHCPALATTSGSPA